MILESKLIFYFSNGEPFYRMPSRRERALATLICTMAYRDAVECQMEALSQYKEGISTAAVLRLITRELARLRREFNLAQAQIESMRGRMLPVAREQVVDDDTVMDPQSPLCNCAHPCNACH